jgi:phospholipid-binding lipoprotein MlaA
MKRVASRKIRAAGMILAALLLLSGCAAEVPHQQPPMRTAAEYAPPDKQYAIDVYDPIEGFNRGVYRFNFYFDKYFFLPVVRTYEFILPVFVQDRISKFVDNVYEFNNFTNSLLQGKFKKTGITLSRFVVNSVAGIGGLFDPATSMGLARQNEDFGQTLGFYGVGDGPYLVLPILGPSNLRDTVGLAGDAAAFSYLGPPAWADSDEATYSFTGVAAVDKRHREKFRYYSTGTPFEYDMVRLLYAKKRQLDVEY